MSRTKTFSFFVGIIIDQTRLWSIPLFVFTLSLFFSHSGHANMGTTRLPFTELCVRYFPRGGGGGVKALNKFLYEEALPRVPTPCSYPFMYHFSQKRYPFHVPSINKWYPFHIPCLELFIPFNCCKGTVF